MQVIAIIPAKKDSTRLKQKNIRKFCDYPLFLYSAFYAQQEGVMPVVSSDDDNILALCRRYGIRTVKELVDDSDMCNCVRQVLKYWPCDYFVILLPSSPLRERDKLRKMLRITESSKPDSYFTTDNIKGLGVWEEKMYVAKRDQDCTRWFHAHDGNILICKKEFFMKNNSLFCEKPFLETSEFPCNLQINKESEFIALEDLAKKEQFKKYLAQSINTICIVSNRHTFKRNYSKFVDSCDMVVRVNRMENWNSGNTGERTDCAVITPNQVYFTFSPEARHHYELKDIPLIYFVYPHRLGAIRLIKEADLDNYDFTPDGIGLSTAHFSTYSIAVTMMHWLYPRAHIYCLADPEVKTRTGPSMHVGSGEDEYMQRLKDKGVLSFILEENCSAVNGAYSTMTEQDMITYFGVNKVEVVNQDNLTLVHPRWTDTNCTIDDGRLYKSKYKDSADIIYYDGKNMVLSWPKWSSMELFQLKEDGSFVFLTTDRHMISTVMAQQYYGKD